MGVILEVELVNFMCHSYLEVKFGSQVNFLTGANGSTSPPSIYLSPLVL